MYCKKFIVDGLDVNKPLFWDTETIGLYGRTRLIQVRQGEISYVYDCFYINIEDIKHFFKNWHLVIHNAHYDLSCLDFKRWLPTKLDDTLIAARIQWPELTSHSLGSLAEHFGLDEKTQEGKSDWASYALTDAQLAYAETDTLILEKLYGLLNESTLSNEAYLLDIVSIKLACVYQHKGMPISHKNILKIRRELKKEEKLIHLPEELNVNSSKQVTSYLKIDSGSKENLQRLNDPTANAVLAKRHIIKTNTYLDDLSNLRFAYSLTSPGSAITGRFTSKGSDEEPGYFNLQQIPRKFKHIFGTEGRGYYVCADYPALEIWMAGAILGDPLMVKALSEKDDLHYATAEKLYKKPRTEISKLERMVAKQCNFTLLYGAGAKRLAEAFINEGKPELAPVAAQLRNDWLKVFSTVAAHQQKIFSHFSTHNSLIVHTPLGRPMNAKKPTEALNFAIQGGGAECTKIALMLLDREGIIPVNTVHDSIALVASTLSEAEEYAKVLKWAMAEGYVRVASRCLVSHLCMDIEVDIGENYQ